jgi:hypothetical protein
MKIFISLAKPEIAGFTPCLTIVKLLNSWKKSIEKNRVSGEAFISRYPVFILMFLFFKKN